MKSEMGNDLHRRVWWICPAGPGHIWQNEDAEQSAAGTDATGCPCCAGGHPTVEDCLKAAHQKPSQWRGSEPSFHRRGWWRCTINEQHYFFIPPEMDAASEGPLPECPFCFGH